FHPEVNFEIVTLLAKEQFKMIRPPKSFSSHSFAEVTDTVLLTFLRGISTEKGIAILDRYLEKRLKRRKNLHS
ncbi:MAG: TetR/AcrR family transcriptional regulator, partial [Tannerellaceae bacterium]|nr:TetR/AcrR family transcriptional regulator [Tannerellaceae bacterium]